MNLAITNLIPAAANAAPAPVPVRNDVPASVPAQGALPAFAQWLDEMAAPVAGTGDPADQGQATGETGHAPAAAASTDSDTPAAQPSTLVQDPAMLAAMAMPLMAAVAVPLPLAPASSGQAHLTGTRGQAAGVAPVVAGATMDALIPSAGSALLVSAAPETLPGAGPAGPQALAEASARGTAAAPDQASAAGNVAVAGPAAAAPAIDRSTTEQATPAANLSTGAAASGWGIAASAPSQPAAPATVALAGPPAAWRQTLHEALGERLQTQVGNNFQQAVIRLEPPDLGRIDISIRHTAGTLEVALSATHGEVVRQLHNVSDNLRNDLAVRQYAEVTVSVSQAPRAQQPGMSAFADQQGRQRQGGREADDAAPGLALADAGATTSTFSLNGRE